ncbi:MAG: DNA recombination protein RmuC [Verrucomicrobia bacterium]|nr:DNA recombination protein RmuC [Verrucomicrobiota bacterium]
MVWLLLRRKDHVDLSPLLGRLDTLERLQERTERATTEEIARLRQESSEHARGLREEVQATLKASTDTLVQSVDRISAAQGERLSDFSRQLTVLKEASDASAAQLRQELLAGLNRFKEAQDGRLSENTQQLQQRFEVFDRRLGEFGKSAEDSSKQARAELSASLRDFRESLKQQLAELSENQRKAFEAFAGQLARLTESNERKSDELRALIDGKLKELQADNAQKIEEMRKTVDEKLQGTLEKRLGESFKLVSERLEQVHKGLGEMQNLASGVGDLKRVLTNVKTRGTWAEVQLGNLLEQILTPEQYARNVITKPSGRETVEFALRLPGRDDDDGKIVWLPIDAKFPKEDYERLVEASERGDAAGVEQAGKDLEARVTAEARDIRDKYLAPPHTTDFGLLYLPTEGLYAEVLRRPGLVDTIQRGHRVVIVGPTTLAALLNSLQMGFRTLAIQKRSSEVWKVLGAVKTDFSKFGDLLDNVKRKLDETGATIEKAAHRSRQLEKKLRKVEALPAAEANSLLADGPASDAEPEGPGENAEET